MRTTAFGPRALHPCTSWPEVRREPSRRSVSVSNVPSSRSGPSPSRHPSASQLAIIVQKEVDGIEMGVLGDGTPYLSGSGLAKLCGTARSTIYERAAEWRDGNRSGKFARYLIDDAFTNSSLYVETTHRGSTVHAYTDNVAVRILGYYAFEVGNDIAKRRYRALGQQTLRDFVYTCVGYDPKRRVPDRWQQFHDRTLLNVVPAGYFSVFRETVGIVLAAMRAGLPVDSHIVPDISVGIQWSDHWQANNLDTRFGARKRYDHYYSDGYPQAASNPQPAFCYPVDALGVFHRWLLDEYLPGDFPGYLARQAKKGMVGETTAVAVLGAVGVPAALPVGATRTLKAPSAKKRGRRASPRRARRATS